MLLDESTNNLDIERIEWLKNYIKTLYVAKIKVFHDLYFLDKIPEKILEIDDREMSLYNCNYSAYLEEKGKNL